MLLALFSGLVHGRPIRIGGACDAFDTLKHTTLAKSEARYVHGAVTELRHWATGPLRPLGTLFRLNRLAMSRPR